MGRHLRRLSRTGLWERLLRALARPDAPAPLRAPEHWIRRACRRAARIRGSRVIALARRLGFLPALRGPSWLPPDPHLSEPVFRRLNPVLERAHRHGLRTVPPGLRTCGHLLGAAAGKRRIARCLQPFLCAPPAIEFVRMLPDGPGQRAARRREPGRD